MNGRAARAEKLFDAFERMISLQESRIVRLEGLRRELEAAIDEIRAALESTLLCSLPVLSVSVRRLSELHLQCTQLEDQLRLQRARLIAARARRNWAGRLRHQLLNAEARTASERELMEIVACASASSVPQAFDG